MQEERYRDDLEQGGNPIQTGGQDGLGGGEDCDSRVPKEQWAEAMDAAEFRNW